MDSKEIIGWVIAISVGLYVFAYLGIPAISTYFNSTLSTNDYMTNVPSWFITLLGVALIGVPVGLLLKFLEGHV
jgi:hypothetical protein